MPFLSPGTPDRAARPALFLFGALFVPVGITLAVDGHAFGFGFLGVGLFLLGAWWLLQPGQPSARAKRLQRWAAVLSLVSAALVLTAGALFLGVGAHRPSFAELAPGIGVTVLAAAALAARVLVGGERRRAARK
ncbi:hypothetical protein GCM10027445_17260 [Amycolatopsis endophytica]|uniref:Peptidoglycan/LPS O-acetylase OafA/YrhL n=1 Tax=Amycolatopsis endophytica TaxID=860233 RepID=A0A853B4V0_9PSEU|nr:hypothetical protein [Amycolatopsis endophytica]NYI90059.1 peptidoglycan/LPS O-acetylase OafA/YrhL [Amycolatopsis endophytica]